LGVCGIRGGAGVDRRGDFGDGVVHCFDLENLSKFWLSMANGGVYVVTAPLSDSRNTSSLSASRSCYDDVYILCIVNSQKAP
jgi:hypothetical protein